MTMNAMMFRRITKERACPECRSMEIYRVRRVGFAVKAVCRILNVRPYWCEDCDAFFFAPGRSGTQTDPGSRYKVTNKNPVGHGSHAG